MSSADKSSHGPLFPYRFSVDVSDLYLEQRPNSVPHGQPFCRWNMEQHPKALEWNAQGKGKGPTILTTDDPSRCCSDLTPCIYLHALVNDIAGIAGPGSVYTGYIAGRGWYHADPGTDFLVRLVTSKEEVNLLRDEAILYEAEREQYLNEPLREKNAVTPLEFYGFFQTDAQDAAAVILEYRGPPPEGWTKTNASRKRKGKKKQQRQVLCKTRQV